MNSQVVQNNSHLATFETIVAYGTSNETNQDSTSLPPFGNITQSDQVEENKRDILMPIQQNIIGSSTNFAQIQSRMNGSISPLSKTNTPSSGFSTSSEESATRYPRGAKNNLISESPFIFKDIILLDIIIC